MKLELPKNLNFDRPCIYPSGQYLMLAEEENLHAVLNTMPVIGVGRKISLRVRETMRVLEKNGSELEIPEVFQQYLSGDSAMIIETEEILFGKQYRICSIENGKVYLDTHAEQPCNVYECEVKR